MREIHIDETDKLFDENYYSIISEHIRWKDSGELVDDVMVKYDTSVPDYIFEGCGYDSGNPEDMSKIKILQRERKLRNLK
jgi:hypothetical protein